MRMKDFKETRFGIKDVKSMAGQLKRMVKKCWKKSKGLTKSEKVFVSLCIALEVVVYGIIVYNFSRQNLSIGILNRLIIGLVIIFLILPNGVLPFDLPYIDICDNLRMSRWLDGAFRRMCNGKIRDGYEKESWHIM